MKNDSLIFDVAYQIGFRYYYLSDYNSSLNYFLEASRLASKKGLKSQSAKAYNGIGALYYTKGLYEKALENYLLSLNIAKQLKDSARMLAQHMNIGMLYMEMNELDKAEEYFKKTEAMSKTTGNEEILSGTYMSWGTVERKRGNFGKAKELYDKSIIVSKKYNDMFRLSETYENYSSLFFFRGNYKQAEHMLLKGAGIDSSMNNTGSLIAKYESLGSLYLKWEKPEKAGSYFKKVIDLSRATGLTKYESNGYYWLSDYYEAINEPDSALHYLKYHYTFRDSNQLSGQEKKVTELESLYKLQQKQMQLESAEKNKKIQELKLSRNQTRLYAISAAGLLLLVAVIFAVRAYLQKRKSAQIIQKQKELVEEKSQEIIDSINYAKRLQEAILPPQKLVKEYLQQSFILYKPKDIVAGDFYWMETVGDVVYFSAADCTGHGVPGAMVSVVCSNALSKALIEENITNVGKLLDRTRELVVERFGRSEENIQDGMDIALCALNDKTNELHYSGANDPLWVIRKGATEVEETKADKQPIGKYDKEDPFTAHTLQLNPGDSLYIFSDGYPDQFGGPKGKKYKTGAMKKFLLSIQDNDMATQRQLLNDEFEKWKGELEQIDDVCVVGVRI